VLRQFQDVIRAIEDEKNERLRQQFQELSRAAREGENERARQQAQEFGGLDAAREAVSGSFGSRWNEYLARLFEQLALDAPKRIDTRKNKSAATPTADHNQLFGAILTRNRKSLEAGTATIASLAHKYAAKVAPRDAAKRQEVFRAIQAFGYRWDKKLKSDD
jgi:hypothetical protein